MNQSRNRFWIVVISMLLLGSLLCFHWFGNNGEPILLIVPAKFTGAIQIFEDASTSPIPFIGKQYVIIVPTSGILHVRSLKPFDSWHQFKSCYSDETQLVHPFFDNDLPNEITLRGGGSRSTRDAQGRTLANINYFVGTARQYAMSNDPDMIDPDFVGPFYPKSNSYKH